MTQLDDDTIKALRTLLYEMETGARDIARRIGGENPAPTWADNLAIENKDLKKQQGELYVLINESIDRIPVTDVPKKLWDAYHLLKEALEK